MGIVALVGLLAGGPLGLCLALAYGVVTVMKIAKVDSQYAARGETPPSYRLVERWLDARKARGQAPADAKPARYGMWRYFWQRWFAMWELMGEEHTRRHEEAKQARAEAHANGVTVPKERLRDRIRRLKVWQWMLDTLVAPVGEKPAPESPAAPVQPETPEGPRVACPDCGQTLRHVGDQWDHPSSAGCPAKPAPQTAPEPQQEPEPVEPVEQSSTATAPAPADCGNTTQGAPDMTQATQQSGEVVGLTSAINYAEAVAAAHAAHSLGGGESYMASLGQAEVGPETIQSAAAAQEASAIAAGAWQTHAGKLREQLAAKEAVTSETGKKEFLLAD